MPSILKNLMLVFLGSILGTATVLALVGLSPGFTASVSPTYPSVQAATMAGRLSVEEDLAVDIYQRLSPAVVYITNRQSIQGNDQGNRFQERGIGSGVIIDDLGHILTNNHVVNGADNLEVTLFDGARVPARLLGRDPGNDLAVIQVELDQQTRSRVSVAPMGNSDSLRPGQLAIAIGNPFGYQTSMTSGIISSLGRSFPSDNGYPIRNMIQIDAAVNPGNSGGPLINSAGEVVGINTAIESPVRGFVGLGFAVPINTIRRHLPDMLAGKTVSHAWLGVSGWSVDDELADAVGLPTKRGIYVVGVLPDSPAEKAGLQGSSDPHARELGGPFDQPPMGGDVITGVDGRSLYSVDDLAAHLDSKRVGDTISLAVLREGMPLEVRVVLAARPAD